MDDPLGSEAAQYRRRLEAGASSADHRDDARPFRVRPDHGSAVWAKRIEPGPEAAEPGARERRQTVREPPGDLDHELVLVAARVVVRVDDVVQPLLRVEPGDQGGRALVPEVEAQLAGRGDVVHHRRHDVVERTG